METRLKKTEIKVMLWDDYLDQIRMGGDGNPLIDFDDYIIVKIEAETEKLHGD